MFFVEPPRSQGDVVFRLFDFPIRVHPYFWLVAVILGFRPDGTPPLDLLVWVSVVLVSIIVHELGHALLQRRYGGNPRVVLYSFGGLAIAEGVEYTPRRQILISIAGPAAGFLLAFATLLLLRMTGHAAGIQLGRVFDVDRVSSNAAYSISLIVANVYWEPLQGGLANSLVGDLLAVNFFWGMLNLLPIYPLDGGQVSRELCTLHDAHRGVITSLRISMAAAAFVTVLALSQRQLFMALMFGYLAYTNFQTMQRIQGSRW